MPRYDELKIVRRLSGRGDTNSAVDLVQDEDTGTLYVRKPFLVLISLYTKAFSQERRKRYIA